MHTLTVTLSGDDEGEREAVIDAITQLRGVAAVSYIPPPSALPSIQTFSMPTCCACGQGINLQAGQRAHGESNGVGLMRWWHEVCPPRSETVHRAGGGGDHA